MSRRGESIYKRKDGRWEARFVRKLDEDKGYKLVSVYGKTYTEAKNKRTFLQSNEIVKTVNNFTLNNLLFEWLEFNRNRIKQSSYQKYEGIIRNHIRNTIGEMPVIDISRAVLTKFAYDQMLYGNAKTGGSLSPKSVNMILSFISTVLEWHTGSGGVFKMPFVKENHKMPNLFTPGEQHKLETYIKGNVNSYTLGILVALYAGLRLGEVCALDWTDISDGVINVCKTMQRIRSSDGKWEIVISEPKTECSRRVVPVSADFYAFLEGYRQPTGYILLQENGHFIEPRLLQKRFESIINQIGIQHKTFHSLRHTFATRLIEKGCDPKTVSALLGHSNVQITLNRYVHPSVDMKRKAVEKISFFV